MQKTMMRWYLTPQQMAKFQSLSTPVCWGECTYTGTLLHIMWTCQSIRKLWSEIENILQKILQYPIILTPQLGILNLTIELIPPKLRLITTHVLLATKLLITRRWKTEIPSSAEVIALVHNHYIYETVLSRGKLSYSKTHELWLPWAQW